MVPGHDFRGRSSTYSRNLQVFVCNGRIEGSRGIPLKRTAAHESMLEPCFMELKLHGPAVRRLSELIQTCRGHVPPPRTMLPKLYHL